MLVTCVLKLCKFDICCRILTLKRLTATFSHVELILEESSVVPSTFIVELGKLLPEGVISINEALQSPLEFCKCLESFSVKQFICSGTIRHVRAELSLVNNDSEHPLPFVSGLLVGVEFDITLHNITSDSRMWLSMTMNDDHSSQCAFLDWNFSIVALFYGTPKASSFRQRVKCLFDDAVLGQTCEGPRRELTFLCLEKQFYLFNVLKAQSHSLH